MFCENFQNLKTPKRWLLSLATTYFLERTLYWNVNVFLHYIQNQIDNDIASIHPPTNVRFEASLRLSKFPFIHVRSHFEYNLWK